VQGGLSGFTRAASGHCYFSLKDLQGDAALIRCAMFRRAVGLLDFAPADGQAVELRGRIAVYEPRGELQFVVESMQRVGASALHEQFLRLKARLEAEGLFDAARKRALPAYPRRIGVITSLGAAALRDVLTALARRAPQVEVVVVPSLVQGAEAPMALVQALADANAWPGLDLLLLVRGGGSLEDLWAFNDERVVRAVAASALPVVCGVGHETDFTLADFAADLRAPTPTAAAELAAPARQEQLDALALQARRLRRTVQHALERKAQRLDRLAASLSRPAERLLRLRQALQALQSRARQALLQQSRDARRRQQDLAQALGRALPQRLALERLRLQALTARLAAHDPRQVMARGYAWVSDEQGRPVTSVAQLAPGQMLQASWLDGEAQTRVEHVKLGPTPLQ
jgi:exodeoxyribonuclease VII large subunit